MENLLQDEEDCVGLGHGLKMLGFPDRNQHLSTLSAQWANEWSRCDDANNSNDDVCHNMGRGGGGQVWLGQVDTGGTQLARAGAAPLRSAQIPQSCAGCKSGGWG